MPEVSNQKSIDRNTSIAPVGIEIEIFFKIDGSGIICAIERPPIPLAKNSIPTANSNVFILLGNSLLAIQLKSLTLRGMRRVKITFPMRISFYP
jgi:hypothetical protein